MSAWKMRVAPAALLGIGLFSLMFLLLGVKFAADDTIAILVGGLILAVVAGGYSLLATYVLTRGLPRASRNLWIVLALNAVLLLAAPVVLIAEPGNFQGPLLLGIAIISIACSYGGLTLAARAAGRRDTA
jgi:peptidoglycan/LPS O-acetylase OafA/YrhL